MDSLSSVSPSFVLPPGKPLRHHHHRRRISVSSKVKLARQLRLSFSSGIPRSSFGRTSDSLDRRRTLEAYCKLGGGEGGDDEEEGRRRDEEVESALRMDGTIPGTPNEFVKQVSSRAYDMRRHLQQSFDSSSYDGQRLVNDQVQHQVALGRDLNGQVQHLPLENVALKLAGAEESRGIVGRRSMEGQVQLLASKMWLLEANPWRETPKPVYVLTHRENQLCTMKTRRNQSEVERELGLLFSKGGKRRNQAKQTGNGTKFQMVVEDVREGVLVFEDGDEAVKYCDLLQGGGQDCEGVAEIEASSVFDLCRKMRALAVLFRRGRTPPRPENLKLNLRARKHSLEDQ